MNIREAWFRESLVASLFLLGPLTFHPEPPGRAPHCSPAPPDPKRGLALALSHGPVLTSEQQHGGGISSTCPMTHGEEQVLRSHTKQEPTSHLLASCSASSFHLPPPWKWSHALVPRRGPHFSQALDPTRPNHFPEPVSMFAPLSLDDPFTSLCSPDTAASFPSLEGPTWKVS